MGARDSVYVVIEIEKALVMRVKDLGTEKRFDPKSGKPYMKKLSKKVTLCGQLEFEGHYDPETSLFLQSVSDSLDEHLDQHGCAIQRDGWVIGAWVKGSGNSLPVEKFQENLKNAIEALANAVGHDKKKHFRILGTSYG